MTHIHRKLTLLALCAALSATAQTPDAQVSFHVEIVQAAQGAADAIEAKRLTRYRDLGETDDIAVHLLDEQTRIGPIITAERGKGTLETLAVPALTARNTLAVDYLIGGRHRLPVVADEVSLSKLPRNVRRPDPPEIIRETRHPPGRPFGDKAPFQPSLK